MKRPLEKEIQAGIVEMLEAVGATVYRIGTTRKKGDHQGTMQTPGIPDLCAFVTQWAMARQPTVQIWIEVKRPGGKMSEAQKTFRAHAVRAGCEHVVGGIEEVVDCLEARGVVK